MAKFFINNTEVEIINSSELSITLELDSDTGIYTKDLGGGAILKKDCCGSNLIWDSIYNDAINNICNDYTFSVTQFESGFEKEIFSGIFSHRNCTFNRCTGEIEISFQTNDIIDCINRQWTVKHNVFGQNITSQTFQVGTDQITYSILISHSFDINNVPQPSDDIVLNTQWGLVTTAPTQVETFLYGLGINIFAATYVFARLISSNPVGANAYPVGDMWATPYDPSTSPRTLTAATIQTNALEELYTVSTPLPDVIGITNVPNYQNNFYTSNTWVNSFGSDFNLSADVDGFIKVSDAIQFLVDELECGITWQSDLLTADTNYVTGEINNPLKRLYINDTSNVINFGGAQATVLEISLEQLIGDLIFQFGAKILIEGSVLRIESSSYTNEDGIFDISDEGYSAWSFSTDKNPIREIWQTADQESFLEYPDCSSLDETTVSNQRIYTNLPGLIDNQNASLDGAVYIVHDGMGVTDGSYMLLDNLITNYHKYERPQANSLLNGEVPFSAETTGYIIEQIDISYLIENFSDYNPFFIHKTSIGENGRLERISYDISTRQATLKILHNEIQ